MKSTSKRNKKIYLEVKKRKETRTLAEIAAEHGITKQRVWQIYNELKNKND